MTSFIVALSIFCHAVFYAGNIMKGNLKDKDHGLYMASFFGVIWTWVWIGTQLYQWAVQ